MARPSGALGLGSSRAMFPSSVQTNLTTSCGGRGYRARGCDTRFPDPRDDESWNQMPSSPSSNVPSMFRLSEYCSAGGL